MPDVATHARRQHLLVRHRDMVSGLIDGEVPHLRLAPMPHTACDCLNGIQNSSQPSSNSCGA
jgi:hypothetical protein